MEINFEKEEVLYFLDDTFKCQGSFNGKEKEEVFPAVILTCSTSSVVLNPMASKSFFPFNGNCASTESNLNSNCLLTKGDGSFSLFSSNRETDVRRALESVDSAEKGLKNLFELKRCKEVEKDGRKRVFDNSVLVLFNEKAFGNIVDLMKVDDPEVISKN